MMQFPKQKQYYNNSELMDFRQHEEALQSIRSKYGQIAYTTLVRANNKKDNLPSSIPNDSAYQTPIKTQRTQDAAIKNSKDQKNQPQEQIKSYFSVPAQQYTSQSVQMLTSKKLSFAKNNPRDFDDILEERDKQLTERVQRNKQLLSMSKEIRQKESRNGSIQPNNRDKKEQKDSRTELQRLKLILKDKNYLPNHKNCQKQINTLGSLTQRDQFTYSSIKDSVTDKMKKRLAQNFSTNPTLGQITPAEKAKKGRDVGKIVGLSTKDSDKKCQKQSGSLIKTPIPPPNESSPSKISSIFQNTHKIEQRIHALLSR